MEKTLFMCGFDKNKVPWNTFEYLKFMHRIHHVRMIFLAMRFGFTQPCFGARINCLAGLESSECEFRAR